MPSNIPLKKDDILHILSGDAGRDRPDNVWAVYSRQSHFDPRNPGYSMEFQPDAAEKFARDHGALEVIYFDDANKSGKNSKRDGLQELIYEVKAGRIDVVVFHRIDRVFRNLSSLLDFVGLLKKFNVRFVSVTEHIDTAQWWGKLVLVVLGSLAEAYLWQTSERVRETLGQARSKGKQLGRIPLGYCNGLCSTCTNENGKEYCTLYCSADRPESRRGKVMVPHPVDRHVIPLIFNLYEQGMSFQQIANYLNNNLFTLPDGSRVRFRTRGKRSKDKSEAPNLTFRRDSIRALIENPTYAGQIARYRRPEFSLEDDLEHPENIPSPKIDGDSREILELFEAQHEPLISFETWQHAQSLKKGRVSSHSKKGVISRVYPLSGVARCWECFETIGQEYTLRGSTGGRGHVYYRCAYSQDQAASRRKRVKPKVEGVNPIINSVDEHLTSRHKYLNTDKLEDQINRLIARLVIPRDWEDLIAAYFLSDDGMAEFERVGYAYRDELRQLGVLYKAGSISGPDLERQTRLLSEKLVNLKPSVKPESKDVVGELRPFIDLWSRLDNQEKRTLLDIIFAGLYFDRDGRLIRALAYEPFAKILDLPEDGILTETMD
jgi:DNA invertase Pin-like site-specific DNA recombinase